MIFFEFCGFALSFAKVYKNLQRAKNGQKLLFYNFFALSLQSQTRVAKLVDALVSGSSGVTTLSVRVRSRVQRIKHCKSLICDAFLLLIYPYLSLTFNPSSSRSDASWRMVFPTRGCRQSGVSSSSGSKTKLRRCIRG